MPINLLRIWPALLGLAMGALIAAGLYQVGFQAGESKQLATQKQLELQWQGQALAAERAY